MTCHSQLQKKFKNKTKQHWKVRKSANSNLWFTCDIKEALFWQALSSHQVSSILTSSKHCLDIKKALSWHQASSILMSSKLCLEIKQLSWHQARITFLNLLSLHNTCPVPQRVSFTHHFTISQNLKERPKVTWIRLKRQALKELGQAHLWQDVWRSRGVFLGQHGRQGCTVCCLWHSRPHQRQATCTLHLHTM